MGPVLKGAFSKGKGTFWKNRLYSKLVVSFAEDGWFLLASFADKNSPSLISTFSEPMLLGPPLMGSALDLGRRYRGTRILRGQKCFYNLETGRTTNRLTCPF